MALIVQNRNIGAYRGYEQDCLYNDLDSAVTAGVLDELLPRLDAHTALAYGFDRAMQGPAMTMQLRGILVDDEARRSTVTALKREDKRDRAELNELAEAEWKKPLNPLSPSQVMSLLYDTMHIPVQRSGKGYRSSDKDCLQRIIDGSNQQIRKAEAWPRARVIASMVAARRAGNKTISVLQHGVSADGRMRSSFNVGAAVTARWSSSTNCFGEGENLQNLANKVRRVFVPDPGWRMCYADLEQAESNIIAHVAEDENYIAAHAAGNVHVIVGRMLFPEVPWTGDMGADKELAKGTPVPWDNDPDKHYYYAAKRCQHGMNYKLTAAGLGRRMHMDAGQARAVHGAYYARFPGIPAYHRWVKSELKRTSVLFTPMGRKRQFFGRYWDDSTLREAVAHVPQSTCVDILNIGLFRMWKALDPDRIQVLQQGHDAVLFQYREDDEAVLQEVTDMMRVEVPIHGRVMVLGVDVTTGKNWQECS